MPKQPKEPPKTLAGRALLALHDRISPLKDVQWQMLCPILHNLAYHADKSAEFSAAFDTWYNEVKSIEVEINANKADRPSSSGTGTGAGARREAA